MTGAPRLGAGPSSEGGGHLPGLRVVLDARPLQDPERSPATAMYLDGLLGAFDADPLPGESFALLLQSDLDDPTTRFDHLDVVGRRLVPPTRLLGPGALTVDPFLLRGASLGAAWRAERGGAAGAVYHAAAGSPPLLSRVPIVVTLLDLAPWHLPATYQGTMAARFGQRLRARILRDAAAVIVGTEAVARDAARLVRIRRSHLRVVRMAPRPAFGSRPGGRDGRDGADEERRRLGLPERFLVYPGRYDARQDLATLLRALRELATTGRPSGLASGVPWPPRILLVGASPDDRAALARAAAREGVGDALAYAPALPPERLAVLVRAARGVILPALSDASGFPAIEAIASGVPVVASSVGALPEIVGPAGILVGPRDATRLAAALRTVWSDETVHRRLVGLARDRARAGSRSWADVARETRAIYAEVGVRREH